MTSVLLKTIVNCSSSMYKEGCKESDISYVSLGELQGCSKEFFKKGVGGRSKCYLSKRLFLH